MSVVFFVPNSAQEPQFRNEWREREGTKKMHINDVNGNDVSYSFEPVRITPPHDGYISVGEMLNGDFWIDQKVLM